jgi:diadenosine tetraphosphate (Ap4A) HIT family hydrolase
MTEHTRVAWDLPAYERRIRAACFICEILSGNPDYPHHIVHRDDHAIAFLSNMPWLVGHLLVAPTRHREHVIGDFTLDEYLRLQRLIHAAGEALVAVVPTERLYVLSLGSQQGNRHVHWHLAPLPPGLPYDQQQFEAMSTELGYLAMPPDAMADLAAKLGLRLQRTLHDPPGPESS